MSLHVARYWKAVCVKFSNNSCAECCDISCSASQCSTNVLSLSSAAVYMPQFETQWGIGVLCILQAGLRVCMLLRVAWHWRAVCVKFSKNARVKCCDVSCWASQSIWVRLRGGVSIFLRLVLRDLVGVRTKCGFCTNALSTGFQSRRFCQMWSDSWFDSGRRGRDRKSFGKIIVGESIFVFNLIVSSAIHSMLCQIPAAKKYLCVDLRLHWVLHCLLSDYIRAFNFLKICKHTISTLHIKNTGKAGWWKIVHTQVCDPCVQCNTKYILQSQKSKDKYHGVVLFLFLIIIRIFCLEICKSGITILHMKCTEAGEKWVWEGFLEICTPKSTQRVQCQKPIFCKVP